MAVFAKWAILLFLSFIGMLSLFAQGTPTKPPEEPLLSDSVQIEWSRAEWFGKSRFSAGKFGSGKYIRGISSTSNKVLVNGHEELMTREPFRVEFQDSASNLFRVKGKSYKSDGVWSESNSGLFSLLKLDIEEETYMEDMVDIQIITADIQQAGEPGDTWKLHLKRNQSKGTIWEESDAILSNGTRVIQIRGPVDSGLNSPAKIHWEAGYYDFLEDGRTLARMNRLGTVIVFDRRTPGATRALLLMVAMAMN